MEQDSLDTDEVIILSTSLKSDIETYEGLLNNGEYPTNEYSREEMKEAIQERQELLEKLVNSIPVPNDRAMEILNK